MSVAYLVSSFPIQMFVPSDKHPGIGQKELAAVAREVGEHFTGM